MVLAGSPQLDMLEVLEHSFDLEEWMLAKVGGG